MAESYRIPESNLEKLQEKIEKLAKRATKLRLEPPKVVIGDHEDVPLVVFTSFVQEGNPFECKEPDLTKHKIVGIRRYYTVTLSGEAPVLPGWKLVTVIEHGDTELGNVLRVAPEMTCPAQYRKIEPLCEHCNTVRRRLETFVLLDPEGRYKQIGRNCLADFCRDPEAADRLCSYAQCLESIRGLCEGAEDEDFFGLGGRGINRAPIESILALTARVIRHCGWVSRGLARKLSESGKNVDATANIIESAMFDKAFWKVDRDTSNERKALQAACRDVQDQDMELATKSLEWIRAMRPEAETVGDYLYNALVVASEETAKRKHFGILCSVVASYQRSLEQAEERKRQERTREISEYVGQEKKRGRWEATVMGVKAFEGESYGHGGEPTVRYLYRLAIDDKHIATWWTGKELDVEIGNQIMVVGTVKKHTEYKGTRQTELTRCDFYLPKDHGKCPNCGGKVLICDRGKNCPNCKKRGLKVQDDWFACVTTD